MPNGYPVGTFIALKQAPPGSEPDVGQPLVSDADCQGPINAFRLNKMFERGAAKRDSTAVLTCPLIRGKAISNLRLVPTVIPIKVHPRRAIPCLPRRQVLWRSFCPKNPHGWSFRGEPVLPTRSSHTGRPHCTRGRTRFFGFRVSCEIHRKAPIPRDNWDSSPA